MSTGDPLKDIRDRIAAAEAGQAAKNTPATPLADYGTETGKGFRLVIDFTVPIFVGAAVGLWIDRQLETLPWLTLIFILLGFGAGIMNVFRSAGGYGAVGYRKPDPSDSHQNTPPPESATDEDKSPRE
jgi:ATP synthase protein I